MKEEEKWRGGTMQDEKLQRRAWNKEDAHGELQKWRNQEEDAWPSEGFESHESHRKLTQHRSQWAHFEDIYLAHSVLTRWDHSELAVRFPWVCNSYSEPTATTVWWVIRWSREYLTARSRCEFEVFFKFFVFLSGKWQTHSSKLTESSQQSHSVSHQVSSLWVWC